MGDSTNGSGSGSGNITVAAADAGEPIFPNWFPSGAVYPVVRRSNKQRQHGYEDRTHLTGLPKETHDYCRWSYRLVPWVFPTRGSGG